MWNGFPIGLFKPPTPLQYRQIQWLGSFVGSSSRIAEGSWESWPAPASRRPFERLGTRMLSTWHHSWSRDLPELASDQQVGFHVIQIGTPIHSQSGGVTFCLSDLRSPGVCESEQPQGGTSAETTGGSLYAYGRSLYLTLTEYRHRAERAEIEYLG